MSLLATCPECRKSYSVPHADREWRCQACDAPLVHSEPDGAATAGAEPSLERAMERIAGAKMRDAMRQVRYLRVFLYLAMFGAATQLLGAVVIAWSGRVTPGEAALQLGLGAGLVGLVLAAVYRLERSPFPVALTMALLQTLVAALALLSGKGWLFPCFWAADFWVATYFAARVTRLAREHPDLYLARRMRGRPSKRSAGRRARALEARDVTRRRRGTVAIFAGFALLTAVGFGGIFYSESKRRPEPTQAIEAFVEAWNRADLDALARQAPRDAQGTRAAKLARIGERYGWGERLPAISGHDLEEPRHDRLKVRFVTEGGPLEVDFLWDDGRWAADAMDFRGVKDWRP